MPSTILHRIHSKKIYTWVLTTHTILWRTNKNSNNFLLFFYKPFIHGQINVLAKERKEQWQLIEYQAKTFRGLILPIRLSMWLNCQSDISSSKVKYNDWQVKLYTTPTQPSFLDHLSRSKHNWNRKSENFLYLNFNWKLYCFLT